MKQPCIISQPDSIPLISPLVVVTYNGWFVEESNLEAKVEYKMHEMDSNWQKLNLFHVFLIKR